jgi:hypothetical protein
MLVRPNYDVANKALKTIWQCISAQHQHIKDRWDRFERDPTSSVASILLNINEALDRIRFLCGALMPHCTGIVDPNTGAVLVNPQLIWDILQAVYEASDIQLKHYWATLVDTLLHELIHQAQHDQEPESFATYHRERNNVNIDKSFYYCQASSPYELEAHAYSDARRIRALQLDLMGKVNTDRANVMVSEANVHCLPHLFRKELLDGAGLPDSSLILSEYQSTACAYLDELDRRPEPEIFMPRFVG